MNPISDKGKEVELERFISISVRQGGGKDAAPTFSIQAARIRTSLKTPVKMSYECCSVQRRVDGRQLRGLRAELTGPLEPVQCGAIKECVETVGLAAEHCGSQKSSLCLQETRVSGATGNPCPKHV